MGDLKYSPLPAKYQLVPSALRASGNFYNILPLRLKDTKNKKFFLILPLCLSAFVAILKFLCVCSMGTEDCAAVETLIRAHVHSVVPNAHPAVQIVSPRHPVLVRPRIDAGRIWA